MTNDECPMTNKPPQFFASLFVIRPWSFHLGL